MTMRKGKRYNKWISRSGCHNWANTACVTRFESI